MSEKNNLDELIISDEEAKKYEKYETSSEENAKLSDELSDEFIKAAKEIAKSLENLRFMRHSDFLYELLVTYISSKTNVGKRKVKLVLDSAFEFQRKFKRDLIKGDD